MASEPFNEDRDREGRPRPVYADTLTALADTDLNALRAAVAGHLDASGATFGGGSFVIDPIPRLISAAEWRPVERGLVQRTMALNHFLRDIYSQRAIVSAGLIADAVIDGAEGYEPDLAGGLPGTAPPAAIIGFDLVRDPDGQFLVLEDNLRTPSGFAYLLAARAALLATLPPGLPTPRPVDPALYALLGDTLRAAAPPRLGREPLIIVLTDGPDNVAYYEHAQAARRLRVPLLTPDDLVHNGELLEARLPNGTRRRVDVVYRRTDEDRLRDEAGQLTPVAERLLGPWRAGNVGVVNAFGNGLADDKLVHAHVEDFVRFYLGEEPLIRSVPTMSLDSPAAGLEAAARLPELVIKPRHGHGGTGVMIGSQADAAELSAARMALAQNPELYIAQPIVPLSRHPTVIDGRLEHRHVDLRPFAFCGHRTALVPGGLSRVAFDAGEMVVNSSRNGGGKDTWIVDP